MKKVFSILLALSCLILFAVSVSAQISYPQPTDQFFVNDFAGVLSQQNEQDMQAKGERLYRACKAQVVVVTVQDMQGSDIESYAIGLARQWGIGDQEENNGVLLLLSVKDRKVRIEVGYGLEGALPDSKTGRILDTYGMDYFSNNDFSTGLLSVYNSLINEVYIEYGLEPDDASYEPVEDSGTGDLVSLSFIFIMLVIVIILARKGIWIFGFRGFRGGNHRGGFGGSSGGGFSGGGGSFGGGGSSRGF